MANKLIDIQKDIIVSREWLEDEIKYLRERVYFDEAGRNHGLATAVKFEHILKNSIPAEKLADASYDAGYVDGVGPGKMKDHFLNSKIEIDGK